MKRHLLLILAGLLAVPWAAADKLSDVDVQLLMDRLKALREGEKSRSGGRIDTAQSAFKSAMQSDEAALEFYLKCVEKVRFEDEKRSAQDFREWKRRFKEREDSPEFQRALRHQLNWLNLTLDASTAKELGDLGPKALERLDALFRDADELKGQEGLLKQNVLQTVFSTAYSLGGIEIENWPMAPLMLPEIYDQVVLPPLRKPTKLEELRSAWQKRILHEGTLAELASRVGGGREGGGREVVPPRGERSVSLDRFLSETRPDLQWQMEADLFRAGDQKGAAVRMLEHIEKYLGHKNEAKWISEFETLVTGKVQKEKEAVTEAVAPPSGS